MAQKMNPFPGLRPFEMQEKYLFFGREDQTVELLKRLGQARFMAVVGTSGSGKSSLVRAGLLPEVPTTAMNRAWPSRLSSSTVWSSRPKNRYFSCISNGRSPGKGFIL